MLLPLFLHFVFNFAISFKGWEITEKDKTDTNKHVFHRKIGKIINTQLSLLN